MYESRSSASTLTRIHMRLGVRSGRLRIGAAVLVSAAFAVAAVAAIAGDATATPATTKVTGHIETQLAPGPDCQAATGLCFAGGRRHWPIADRNWPEAPRPRPGGPVFSVKDSGRRP